jgi:hypothetical protein
LQGSEHAEAERRRPAALESPIRLLDQPPGRYQPQPGASTPTRITASGSVEGSYYTWVGQFDTFGLGANTPINTGNLSDGLLALKDGKWVILRVPYPMGFYTKWLDGRIDDPQGGWKGEASGRPSAPARRSHGRRRGHDEQGGTVPAATQPARQVGRDEHAPAAR